MKSLFEPASADEIRVRLARLTPNSQRLWGRMSLPQALAHCSIAFEWALGEGKPPRMMAGRIFGGVVKRLALADDQPLKRNTPTAPGLIVADQREFDREVARLRGVMDRFVEGGPEGCTNHPHTFFGRMTPDEWAVLMYKHTDHHLRQFGA